MVDTIYESRCNFVLRRSGNDYLLGACIKMWSRLLSRSQGAGTIDDIFSTAFCPRDICRV